MVVSSLCSSLKKCLPYTWVSVFFAYSSFHVTYFYPWPFRRDEMLLYWFLKPERWCCVAHISKVFLWRLEVRELSFRAWNSSKHLTVCIRWSRKEMPTRSSPRAVSSSARGLLNTLHRQLPLCSKFSSLKTLVPMHEDVFGGLGEEVTRSSKKRPRWWSENIDGQWRPIHHRLGKLLTVPNLCCYQSFP